MIHVILLAAGYSSRFGSNKLLHTVDGVPMYRRAVETAKQFRRQCRGEPVRLLCVTAYEEIAAELREKDGFSLYGENGNEADGSRNLVVMNRNRELGISHSIALGTEAAGPGGLPKQDGLMFLVCDQPWLAADDLLNLAESFRRSGKSIACMAYGEQMGNPVLFSSLYREELLGLTGDTGGKAVVRRHPGEVCLCRASGPMALKDVDAVSQSRDKDSEIKIDKDIDREEDE